MKNYQQVNKIFETSLITFERLTLLQFHIQYAVRRQQTGVEERP